MDEQKTTRVKRTDIKHSDRVGLCLLRSSRVTRKSGVKKTKLKGHTDVIEEPEYETFWHPTPIAYLMEPLHAKMKAAFDKVMSRETKKVELDLARFPQVNTVMGQLLASVPKKDRPLFGYTNREEANTMFVIERK